MTDLNLYLIIPFKHYEKYVSLLSYKQHLLTKFLTNGFHPTEPESKRFKMDVPFHPCPVSTFHKSLAVGIVYFLLVPKVDFTDARLRFLCEAKAENGNNSGRRQKKLSAREVKDTFHHTS